MGIVLCFVCNKNSLIKRLELEHEPDRILLELTCILHNTYQVTDLIRSDPTRAYLLGYNPVSSKPIHTSIDHVKKTFYIIII